MRRSTDLGWARGPLRGRETRVAFWLPFLAAILMPLSTWAAASASAKPDIFGIWMTIDRNSPNFRPEWTAKPNTPAPEFTAWGAQRSRELGRLGPELPIPNPCEPTHPVGFLGGFFPLQILPGHNQIVMLNEWVAVPRRLYTDGRGHPPADEMLPSWEGHSIAHWEGDTLVVDTIGLNGRSRPLNGYFANSVNATVESLAVPRLPASDQMHLVEQYRVVGKGKILEVTRTINDPKTYVRPFSNTIYLERRPDLDVQEYYCADNQRTKDEGH